jgi:nucleoid-associated protein YgaU
MKIKPWAMVAAAVALTGTAGIAIWQTKTVPQPIVAAVAPAVPAVEIKKLEQQVIVSAISNKVEVAVAPKPVAPSFDTVRVEANGDAVIAGRAAPGTEVVAKLDGMIVASATASADGSFVMIPAKPLPAGAATLSLETNVSGAKQVSETTVAVAVKAPDQGGTTVAVLSPTLPTKIIQAPKPTTSVVLDAVDYDAAGDIIFSGRGKPQATVRLYVDNVIVGEMKADDSGKWSYTGTTTVAPGTHSLRADEIAADGKVASRVELPFLREAPAVVAAIPAPAGPLEPQAPNRIIIQPGNNLWKLSRQIYGAGSRYTVIYEANKTQIRNPRLIYPGQIITAPLAEMKAP